ncbi:MAG: diaminopimelate decarboxylase [Candidatus Omnitrophota bacterium]|nr:MAG: diaminopimelate decarboxylase [Candidatus Omnitrophota bacterium]
MHYFSYKGRDFFCEETKVCSIAQKFGTPLYVYSKRTIFRHFHKIKEAFASINPLICYSVKANSNLSILNTLVREGAGLDIVSGGELFRAKKVNCPPQRVVYASVGKTDEEIKDAIKYGILLFNVESLGELAQINKIAGQLSENVDVTLRINPDIEPKTHKYITTGRKETKFGMDINTARKVFLKRGDFRFLKIRGVHIHIGSQITQSSPFIKAIKKVKGLIDDIKKEGINLKYFNIGGGLGIVYDKEKPQTAKVFADRVLPLLKAISLKTILEPGRFIVGNAGILITKVLYVKDTPSKKFIIVDAGMNDLLRPSLYEAYHRIVPLDRKPKTKDRRPKKADVVGPICESGDFLGKGRKLDVEKGDYLAVLGAGAYGFSMSSNYNSRRLTGEVLVDADKVYCIRERQNYSDLISKECIVT